MTPTSCFLSRWTMRRAASVVFAAVATGCGGAAEAPGNSVPRSEHDGPFIACDGLPEPSVVLRYDDDGYSHEKPSETALFDGRIVQRTAARILALDESGANARTLTALTPGMGPVDPPSLAVDRDGIFYIERGPGTLKGQIMRVGLDGGPSVRVDSGVPEEATVHTTRMLGTDSDDVITAGSDHVARISKGTGAIVPAACAPGACSAIYRGGEWWWWDPNARGISHATGRFVPASSAGTKIIDLDVRRSFVVSEDAIVLTDGWPLARYTLDGKRLEGIYIDPEIVNREGSARPRVLHANASSAIVFQQDLRSSRYIDVFMRYDFASRTTTLLACRRGVQREAVAADGHQIIWVEVAAGSGFVLRRLVY